VGMAVPFIVPLPPIYPLLPPPSTRNALAVHGTTYGLVNRAKTIRSSYVPVARSTCIALVVRTYPGAVHCSVAKKACALDSDAMLIQYVAIGPAYRKRFGVRTRTSWYSDG
jgi:hypothetical protein